MWRKLLWFFFLFAAGTVLAQAPGGVCTDDVAQSISNGVIVPIPYAQIYLCTPGSTSANCVAHSTSVTIYSSPTLTTPNIIPNPFTTDVGGNYFFCAPHGHYALEVVAPQGINFIPDIVFADDWANGGTVSGTWTASMFVGPLTGNASTATALQNVPTNCGTGGGEYAYGIAASGNALCASFPAAAIPFYQTIKSNNTTETQRYAFNFSTNFSISDSSSPNQTNIDLASTISSNTTGLAAGLSGTLGQCSLPDVASGIQSSGSANCVQIPGTTFTATAGYQQEVSGVIDEWVQGPPEPSNFFGTVTVNLPYAFPHSCFGASMQLSVMVPSYLANNAQGYIAYPVSCSQTQATFIMDVGADGVGTVTHYALLRIKGY